MSNQETSRTALITGASAGLGHEFARLFAADHYDLVLVARRRERLEQLAQTLESTYGIHAVVLIADLRDAQAPGRLRQELESRNLHVDVLVNNAGFGKLGEFTNLDAQVALDMLAVNVRTLVHLTHLLLPPMLARRRGHILNIGSVAGFLPGPFMAVYYATKAFVNSFGQSLAEELRGTGVHVTTCCPGPTETEFGAVAGSSQRKLVKSHSMSAHSVALEAYRAMQRNQVLTIPGFKNRLLVKLLRFLPPGFLRRAAARANRFAGPQRD